MFPFIKSPYCVEMFCFAFGMHMKKGTSEDFHFTTEKWLSLLSCNHLLCNDNFAERMAIARIFDIFENTRRRLCGESTWEACTYLDLNPLLRTRSYLKTSSTMAMTTQSVYLWLPINLISFVYFLYLSFFLGFLQGLLHILHFCRICQLLDSQCNRFCEGCTVPLHSTCGQDCLFLADVWLLFTFQGITAVKYFNSEVHPCFPSSALSSNSALPLPCSSFHISKIALCKYAS